MGQLCQCSHEATRLSLQTRCKITDAESNYSLEAKVQCSQITSVRQTLFVQRMCRRLVTAKFHNTSEIECFPQDALITSVDGYKQLLPRTRIAIFKTSLLFSGSFAWSNLYHPLRTPMKIKHSARKYSNNSFIRSDKVCTKHILFNHVLSMLQHIC